MNNSLAEQLAAFRAENKVESRENNWLKWYVIAQAAAPGMFHVEIGQPAYKIMLMSVSNECGWGWLPCPPDRTEANWRRICIQAEREHIKEAHPEPHRYKALEEDDKKFKRERIKK